MYGQIACERLSQNFKFVKYFMENLINKDEVRPPRVLLQKIKTIGRVINYLLSLILSVCKIDKRINQQTHLEIKQNARNAARRGAAKVSLL